jgi:RNA polymerase sigma-70 factor (ECF subfamily)
LSSNRAVYGHDRGVTPTIRGFRATILLGDTMPEDDPDVLRGFRKGDHAAFEAVYRRYAARVMSFAYRLCGDRSEAEDLVQDTFVAAYRGREGFRGRSEMLPWLLGITWRRRRDACRSCRPPALDLRESDLPTGATDGGVECRALDAVMLEAAIDRLPPMLWEAFHLVMVQGLTHREAAEVLGRPVGTVKWCTATAARRLREALRDEPAMDRATVPATAHRAISGV